MQQLRTIAGGRCRRAALADEQRRLEHLSPAFQRSRLFATSPWVSKQPSSRYFKGGHSSIWGVTTGDFWCCMPERDISSAAARARFLTWTCGSGTHSTLMNMVGRVIPSIVMYCGRTARASAMRIVCGPQTGSVRSSSRLSTSRKAQACHRKRASST
jgi:hypothetical protein